MLKQNFEIIKQAIDNSVLPDVAKKDLAEIFDKVEDKYLAALAEAMARHPEWVAKLYQNLQDKRAALAASDTAAWEKIIKEEEAELERMEG